MGSDYNPNSPDALFSRILERLDADAKARENFRTQILKRLDDGTTRMDSQDQALARIEIQALRTNGRVTALEKKWKHVAAKIATGATVLYGVGQFLFWIFEKGWVRFGP